MRLNTTIFFIALLAVMVIFWGCISITGEGSPTTETEGPATTGTAPRVGWEAPGFDLYNLDGQAVSLESLRGRYVMLNFWATWCGPCRMEMPYMQEIHENPGWSEQGLVIAAVNIGEPASQVEGFMESSGLDFMVLLDSSERTARAYNVFNIPTTFFIDRDGIIKYIKIGTFRSTAEIESTLQALFEAKP